jgi:putative addiction module component (TIGR02574 family)
MKAKELINEAVSLPIEERAMVVDSILRSFHAPELDIDQKWVSVAKRRLAELRAGKVRAVPGDEVFTKMRKRFKL